MVEPTVSRLQITELVRYCMLDICGGGMAIDASGSGLIIGTASLGKHCGYR